jgi:hypothetical protein
MAEQPQKPSPTRVTPVLKAQCIQESLDCGNAAAVARRHHLPPERVRAWVREARIGREGRSGSSAIERVST